MWTIAVSLMTCIAGSGPRQQALETRTRAIAPFVD